MSDWLGLGWIFAAIVIIIGTLTLLFYHPNDIIINKCQATLPRNQNCEIIAVPTIHKTELLEYLNTLESKK